MIKATMDEETVKRSVASILASVDSVQQAVSKYLATFEGAHSATHLKFVKAGVDITTGMHDKAKQAQEIGAEFKTVTDKVIANANDINEDVSGLGSIE